MIFNDAQLKRFYGNTESEASSGCVLWTGTTQTRGYAVINLAQYRLGPCGQVTANRIIFEHFNGKIGPNAVVFNTCGNRRCVNHLHMKAGTRSEAYQNAIKHGSVAAAKHQGELNPAAKLDAQKVAQIRELYSAKVGSMTAIGRRFGVSPSAVSLIVRNKRWTEVANA